MAHVRFFGFVTEVAGAPTEIVDASTLGAVLSTLEERHGPVMSQALARCSLLVDGRYTQDLDASLDTDSSVDVLPPFAGG